MRVLVCGGRNFQSPAQVFRALDSLHIVRPITGLMHGGSPTGVDKFAHDWTAKTPDVQGYVCRPDIKRYGANAVPRRNARMLEWQPDLVLAFAGGTGTENMVKIARAAGLKVVRPFVQ